MYGSTRALSTVSRWCTCSHTLRTPRISSRPLSTSSTTVPAPAQAPLSSASTADLLQELKDLLARYPLLQDTRWSSRLEEAIASLKYTRKARIAVVGHKHSGASELVTAAFDDPLSSTGDLTVTLASRRLGQDAPEAIVIAHGNDVQTSPHELEISSVWLKQHKAEIVEIIHSDVGPRESSLDALYGSDAVVLVAPESEGLSAPALRTLLQQLGSKPNLVLALNSVETATAARVQPIQHHLSSMLASSSTPTIVPISTAQAIDALEALAPTESGHKVSFERFQTGYVRSGVPELKEVLAQAVSAVDLPASETGAASSLRQQTVRHTLSAAVSAAALTAAEIEDNLHQTASNVTALEFVAVGSSETVYKSIGMEDGFLRIPEQDKIEAKVAFERLLDGRLTWYLLPTRMDDLVSEIAVVATSSYLPQFEDQLVFSTGRLVSLSQKMSNKTEDLLSTSAFAAASRDITPLSSLYSPLLRNRLAQADRESFSLPSTALSSAVVFRRNQITAPGGPAEILQSRAQKAVASAVSLSGGSVAVGTAMQVLGSNPDLATSAGVGLLGTTLAAWLLQRSWGKAKRKFLIDVEQRVTGGLEEDLGVAARQLVERSTYKARTAVALSQELLRQKQGDFDRFKERLSSIAERVRRLQ